LNTAGSDEVASQTIDPARFSLSYYISKCSSPRPRYFLIETDSVKIGYPLVLVVLCIALVLIFGYLATPHSLQSADSIARDLESLDKTDFFYCTLHRDPVTKTVQVEYPMVVNLGYYLGGYYSQQDYDVWVARIADILQDTFFGENSRDPGWQKDWQKLSCGYTLTRVHANVTEGAKVYAEIVITGPPPGNITITRLMEHRQLTNLDYIISNYIPWLRYL